jgi:DNA-binding CsgD family transcriptional regulator
MNTLPCLSARMLPVPSSLPPLWADLPLPLWVLRPMRELLSCNAAARALERQGQVQQAGGRLMRVGSLLAPALEALLRLPQAQVPQQAALWMSPDQHTGWLQAVPVPVALARSQDWPDDTHLLNLHLDRPELAQQARVEALCERVRLSPAERCVLLLLADGLVPEAVAHRLDIQLSTARTHVRRLLLKSRAPSLTQLLRWVGSAEALPG